MSDAALCRAVRGERERRPDQLSGMWWDVTDESIVTMSERPNTPISPPAGSDGPELSAVFARRGSLLSAHAVSRPRGVHLVAIYLSS